MPFTEEVCERLSAIQNEVIALRNQVQKEITAGLLAGEDASRLALLQRWEEDLWDLMWLTQWGETYRSFLASVGVKEAPAEPDLTGR